MAFPSRLTRESLAQRLLRTVPRLLWLAAWTYLALVVLAAIVLLLAGDATWPLTLFCLGPRWLALVPAGLLVPAALIWNRRALVPLALALVFAIFPVMGFCVPWRALFAGAPHERGQSLRIATINIGNLDDRARLMQFLTEQEPDIIAMQEWIGPDNGPPELGPGWHAARDGQLLVLSRFPIREATASPRGDGRWYSPGLRCEIDTPGGLLHVHCVHLYTLRKGLEAILGQKWRGIAEMKRVIGIRNNESDICSRFARASPDVPTIVVGDFNMTGDSVVFRKHWDTWQDAFAACGWGFGHTFGTRKIGLRIDHILSDPAHCQPLSCRVGPDFHGQHRPLVADLWIR